jgi:FMN reductase [NAD(P)H]
MTNPIIALQKARFSTRDYTDAPIDPVVLAAIVEAGRLTPTSMNAHHVSIIVTQDKQTKAEIAKLSGNQKWIEQAPVFITVVADLYKTQYGGKKAGFEQVIHQSLEGFTVAAIDSGSVLSNMMIAAQSFDLGIVPIGCVRMHPEEIAKLLQLPPLTFPMVGLCIGHKASEAGLKPKMDTAAFKHDEYYHTENLDAAIDDYDTALKRHWEKAGRSDGVPWSVNTGHSFSRLYFRHVLAAAKQQGFAFEQ